MSQPKHPGLMVLFKGLVSPEVLIHAILTFSNHLWELGLPSGARRVPRGPRGLLSWLRTQTGAGRTWVGLQLCSECWSLHLHSRLWKILAHSSPGGLAICGAICSNSRAQNPETSLPAVLETRARDLGEYPGLIIIPSCVSRWY